MGMTIFVIVLVVGQVCFWSGITIGHWLGTKEK